MCLYTYTSFGGSRTRDRGYTLACAPTVSTTENRELIYDFRIRKNENDITPHESIFHSDPSKSLIVKSDSRSISLSLSLNTPQHSSIILTMICGLWGGIVWSPYPSASFIPPPDAISTAVTTTQPSTEEIRFITSDAVGDEACHFGFLSPY